MDFDEYTAELTENCRRTPGVVGLILVGSTTAARAVARDEWSDHDFYAVLADGSEQSLRRSLSFLPFPDRVVTIARDRGIGAAVLYQDGHILEFAAATEAELGQFRLGDHEVAYDAGELPALARSAVARGAVEDEHSAVDEISMAMVKLLIGVGRTRRGELINGGSFVRTYVVGHLVNAILTRLPYEIGPARDGLDAVRRFEECYPSISGPLGLALDRPVEQAARSLYELARSTLEPGWPEFPSAAADVVAHALGWQR